MSENDEETLIPFTPPASSWRLPVFIEAPLEEILAKRVDCSTCPVFFACEAGEGGSGWVCSECKATGVLVSKFEPGELPDHHMVVDCGKHKFHKNPKSEGMTRCTICSGNQMELELQYPDKQLHYIPTVHALVPVEERQKVLKEKFEFWKAEYDKDPKED